MIRSPLRWTGGKSRILEHVLDAIGDVKDKTLIEPFVGSCTVALNVEAKDYILNDANRNLINTHVQTIELTNEVLDHINLLYMEGYEKYNEFRDEFNDREIYDVYKAALFYYLNGHNYNGMYRENKKGRYNIPVGSGRVKDPTDDINTFANTLKSECFHHEDFETIMEFAGEDDVVYIDPPYPADSISASEITYTKDGFSKADHIRLRDACVRAAQRGAKVVVSYCNIGFIRNLYKDADEIREVEARRSVSSKAKTRGKAKEVIIIFNK